MQVNMWHCKAATSTPVYLWASYVSARLSLFIFLTEVSAKLPKPTWFLSELSFSSLKYPSTATASKTINSVPPGITWPGPNPTEPLTHGHVIWWNSQQRIRNTWEHCPYLCQLKGPKYITMSDGAGAPTSGWCTLLAFQSSMKRFSLLRWWGSHCRQFTNFSVEAHGDLAWLPWCFYWETKPGKHAAW